MTIRSKGPVVMAISNLGACEGFVTDLRGSNLIDRGQLEHILEGFLEQHPRAEAIDLAEHLLEQNLLTDFQAERLLEGKPQTLVVGPYVLMRPLGSGSMGYYQALSRTDGMWYAVKVLPRRSTWNVRLARRHLRAFERLQHPRLIPFLDVGTSGGSHYLVWPLVGGDTLEELVAREGKLVPGLVALYGYQIAEGLSVCQNSDFFHSLLKPSNLIVDNENQTHILDFGIGILLAENEGVSLLDTQGSASALAMRLACASPESFANPPRWSLAGDQYSLGCVLYYCLSGQYPFPGNSIVELTVAHQSKQPTPIGDLCPEVPAELAAIVEKLMAKSPKDRFATLDDLLAALRPLADPPPTPAQFAFRLRSVLAAQGENGRPAAKAASGAPRTSPRPPRQPLVSPAPIPRAEPTMPPTPQQPPEPSPALAEPPTPMPLQPPVAPVDWSSKPPPSPASLAPESPAREPVGGESMPNISAPPASGINQLAPSPFLMPRRPGSGASDLPQRTHPDKVTLEDRLGNVGMAILTAVISAAAFLGAFMLFK